MVLNLAPILQGAMLGIGICGSLGPQSMFVLRQSVNGEAAIAVAAICTVVDVLLVCTAAAVAEDVLLLLPGAMSIGAWAGAATAFTYGCVSINFAFRRRSSDQTRPAALLVGLQAVMVALVLSVLNPQVYLEMIGLVGGVAVRFPAAERSLFAIGVCVVSPLWFFGLVAGGRKLAGLFARPAARSAFDGGMGLLMFTLAAIIGGEELGWW